MSGKETVTRVTGKYITRLAHVNLESKVGCSIVGQHLRTSQSVGWKHIEERFYGQGCTEQRNGLYDSTSAGIAHKERITRRRRRHLELPELAPAKRMRIQRSSD